MNRWDFQDLARQRLREARALLNGGFWHGAYYLAGYAVECALKACIARQTKRFDFPAKEANKSYTHNLRELVKLAGLEPLLEKDSKANKGFEVNWAVVYEWSEQSRYETTVVDKTARDLYSAITSRKNGVLPWLRKRW